MNHQVVEESLRKTVTRWRVLKLTQRWAMLGSVACALVLLLGVAAWQGWIRDPFSFWFLATVLTGAVLLALLVITVIVATSGGERSWLAGRIEETRPQLQDRLNTLVHLERGKKSVAVDPFYARIKQQAQQVLSFQPATARFSWFPALAHVALCAGLLVCAIWFYGRYDPYRLLVEAAADKPAEVVPEPQFELFQPESITTEEKEKWGEVLITDPAKDMRVTKVDVVPLQVEAAASESLEKVGWLSTVNGGGEERHELPPPAEPRFAAYSPTIYLDEFNLSDWDVLTYYAQANTESGTNHVSEVYFLEVRPFREDILKMPGGEGGKAYQMINELTGLIEQQQHVIRETHKHVQQPPLDREQQQQDREKLADAEADLSDAAGHLYSKMSSEMENMPVGPAQDQLAKAKESLADASKALRDDALEDARNLERQGLADLVAARKIFQKTVSENPEAFEQNEDEQFPAGPEDPLQQIAEFRDEEKAVQEALQDAVKEQRSIASKSGTSSPVARRRLKGEQEGLQERVEQLQADHPRAFQGLEEESVEAGEAMEKAAEALAEKSWTASAPAQEAAEKLEQLRQAHEQQSASRQLTDAYKLKQILDEQIQKMGQCQKAPGEFSQGDMGEMASQSGEALSRLKEFTEQEPGSDAFGEPLKDALSDSKMKSMGRVLDTLGKTESNSDKQTMAGEAKEAMEEVSEAFEQSTPQPLQMAKSRDSLKPSPQEGMDRGISQLRSLAQRMASGKPLSEADQAKQSREALGNLQRGMRDQFGSNERSVLILERLEEKLQPDEGPVDIEDLKQLIAELQNFSIEFAGSEGKEEDPEVINIDPARMPPAYRNRINKYFEKLSEK